MSVWISFALMLVSCGRLSFEPLPDGSEPPQEDGAGVVDAAPAGDGMSAGDAQAAAVLAGTYALDSTIAYSCAFNLVAIDVNSFEFELGGGMLTVTSDDTGMPVQPCTMMSALPSGVMFDVTCTLPGGCNETYRLAGSMIDANTWSGTFTASFSGSCFNCAMQSFPRSGTAP